MTIDPSTQTEYDPDDAERLDGVPLSVADLVALGFREDIARSAIAVVDAAPRMTSAQARRYRALLRRDPIRPRHPD